MPAKRWLRRRVTFRSFGGIPGAQFAGAAKEKSPASEKRNAFLSGLSDGNLAANVWKACTDFMLHLHLAPLLRFGARGILGVFVLGAAAAVHAEDYELEEARVKLWTPANWSVEQTGDEVFIGDPDDEVFVLMSSMDLDDFEQAFPDYNSIIDHMIADAQLKAPPRETRINGMPAVSMEGRGRVSENEAVEFGFALLKTPSGRALFVLAIVKAEKIQKHKQSILRLVNSIQALPAAAEEKSPAEQPGAESEPERAQAVAR